MIKSTTRISFTVLLISTLGLFLSACDTEEPVLPWYQKDGTADAVDVTFDFENLLFNSKKEIHSYTAILKNEVLTGTFDVHNFDIDGNPVSEAYGDITCMVFEEDCKTTRFVGVITSGSDPTYIGLYAVWTVIDEGSANAKTTDIRYPVEQPTANWHCDGGLELEWYGLPSLIEVDADVKIISENCR